MIIPKIAVGTLIYNDAKGFERLSDSLDKNIFIHLVVDGKFPNQPGEHEFSDDGLTDSILKQLNKEHFIWLDYCPEDEFLKRQRMLWLCKEFKVDALLILDSDEYVDCGTVNWTQFYQDVYHELYHSKTNVFGITGVWQGQHEKPRLWLRPEQMTYVDGSHRIFKNKSHDDFLDIDGCMQMHKRKITSIKFIHDASYRSEQRKYEHDIYYAWLNRREGEIADNRRKMINLL
jgi:hypothetical protein